MRQLLHFRSESCHTLLHHLTPNFSPFPLLPPPPSTPPPPHPTPAALYGELETHYKMPEVNMGSSIVTAMPVLDNAVSLPAGAVYVVARRYLVCDLQA